MRDSLAKLRRGRRGSAYFGDHDFGSIVELDARGDGSIAVHVNRPSEDLWDVELPPMRGDDLERLVEAIDTTEQEFGDLIGYCEACLAPQPTFREERP